MVVKIKRYYAIIDVTTNRHVCFTVSVSDRGAIQMFRRYFALQHNYPYVIAKH